MFTNLFKVMLMSHALRIYAAGSLSRALPAVLTRYEALSGISSEVVYGPAGLLASRILEGDRPDLFRSADMKSPEHLKRCGIGLSVSPWVGNALMLVFPRRGPAARRVDELTRGECEESPLWLRLLLTAGLRIGTSTPHADPGGDYAQKLFDLTSRWGKQFPAMLRAKSRALVGGAVPGKGAKTVTVKEVLLSRQADVFLSYASNAGNYPAESFRTLQIPADENVDARYGMLLMTSRAAPLSRWLKSQEALRLMSEAGFRA